MAKVTNKQLAQALHELTKKADKKEVPQLLRAFIEYVFRKGMFREMPAIIEQYGKHYDKEKGICSLIVTSRYSLTSAQLKTIEQKYLKKLKCETIEIETRLDEKILGGYKVQIGDSVEDATVRTKIKQLEQYLLQNI